MRKLLLRATFDDLDEDEMFQLFLHGRTRNLFQARSAGRDAEVDRARVASISRSIEGALKAAEAEHAGLNRRVDDALARASVTFGNESDEYLTREPLDNAHQDLLGADIANGQRRLRELAVSIEHFKFLKSELTTRFPEFKPPAE
jgi:hypothetical protein